MFDVFEEFARVHLETHTPFPTGLPGTKREGFFPARNPATLHNCKQYAWLNLDGSTIWSVYLNALEEGFREKIVFFHYVRFFARLRDIEIGINYLSRDKPWDFRVEFSTGATFNIEIVSFSDTPNLLKNLTAEELVQRHSHYPTVRIGILKKIARMFPNQEISDLISWADTEGLTLSDSVQNPFYPEMPKLFLGGSFEEPEDLTDCISKAISSKARKRHRGKGQTILILDNRTANAPLTRFFPSVNNLRQQIDSSPFPEIWLYTGYGGGHDPDFEDFLFLPLKLVESAIEVMRNRFVRAKTLPIR